MSDYLEPEKVTENLKEVFNIYRKAGISEESIIIENIAFFALHYVCGLITNNDILSFDDPADKGGQSALQEELGEIVFESFEGIENAPYETKRQLLHFLPSAPADIQILNQIDKIYWLLGEVFDGVGDVGKWFDKDLVPRLFNVSKGGQYATPRHLISFMAGITGLNPDDSLADFACGTGSVLVDDHCLYPWGNGNVTGIEISPNMARLAFTNLILNSQFRHKLYLGNAFYLEQEDALFRKAKFDVVIMNPPFGEPVEPSLVGGLGRSETHFTLFAYHKLKPGGRMAVLVPSSVLNANGAGNRDLRKILVEEGALRAIISLPQDSLQPMSSLDIHILFARKPDNDDFDYSGVWFYRLDYDGFTGKRNRKPDLEHNDFPLVEAAFSSSSLPISVEVTILKSSENVVGYRVECIEDYDFHIEILGDHYTVFAYSHSQPPQRIRIAGAEIEQQEITSGKRLIGRTIFKSDNVKRGVVFDTQGKVVGIKVTNESLLDSKGIEFQSEKYWTKERQSIIMRSAAQILGDIKKNQNQLTITLDRLLSISEVQPIAGTELPPLLHLIKPPIGMLQGVQQSIWKIVQNQAEQVQNYQTPSPFQADDIHEKLNESISVMDVQRTLELFERMGLIVTVSYEGAPYYRLPEERDLVKEVGK